MKQAKSNKKKTPAIRVDKRLDKYAEMGLFQDKLDKANEFLRKAGLPKFSK